MQQLNYSTPYVVVLPCEVIMYVCFTQELDLSSYQSARSTVITIPELVLHVSTKNKA